MNDSTVVHIKMAPVKTLENRFYYRLLELFQCQI